MANIQTFFSIRGSLWLRLRYDIAYMTTHSSTTLFSSLFTLTQSLPECAYFGKTTSKTKYTNINHQIQIIIIIIIIRHELGLNRSVSASSKSFQRSSKSSSSIWSIIHHSFWHLLFSFFLHVVANLISIFLVSRQLVLPSALPKFLRSFCGQKVCIPLFV
jgi:hypothetical protein